MREIIITLPDDVAELLDIHGQEIDLSRICQRAIIGYVDRLRMDEAEAKYGRGNVDARYRPMLCRLHHDLHIAMPLDDIWRTLDTMPTRAIRKYEPAKAIRLRYNQDGSIARDYDEVARLMSMLTAAQASVTIATGLRWLRNKLYMRQQNEKQGVA